MNITISNNVKAAFGSLSLGEVFMLNGTDVCVKIECEPNMWNTWNFQIKGLQMTSDDTEIIIPREVSTEVIL